MKKSILVSIRSINDEFAKIVKLPNENLNRLNRRLTHKCVQYKMRVNAIQESHMGMKIKKRIRIDCRELVACAIAGKNIRNSALGSSHDKLYVYNGSLWDKLKMIGVIGGKSIVDGCDNEVGRCAEVKVANTILEKDKKATITSIEFTRAIRPRTLEPLKRCGNCIAVFGDETN